MKARLLVVPLAALALIVSGCSGRSSTSDTYNFRSATPLGTTYPQQDRKAVGEFTGDLLDGGKLSLSQAAGKVVVVNFWASDCGPCTVETPQFDQVYRAYKTKGVAFIGIDTKDSSRDAAKSFVQNHDVSYPNIYDPIGKTSLEMGHIPADALPFTVLVDANGKVAGVYVGAMTSKDLEPMLNKLLTETTTDSSRH